MRRSDLLSSLVAGACLTLSPCFLDAQQSAPPLGNDRALWAASGTMLAAAFALDERLRSIALANRTPTLDHVANAADVLGTAGHIVPALAATYLGARLTSHHSFANATLRVAVSYFAADALESVLKSAVGRQRPYATGEPWTFRPFTVNGEFQSFPSGHVTHIASLGTAIAAEADRPWVTALAGGAIAFVGAQRVYRDMHWTSDVVASGILAVAAARWMRGKWEAGGGRRGNEDCERCALGTR